MTLTVDAYKYRQNIVLNVLSERLDQGYRHDLQRAETRVRSSCRAVCWRWYLGQNSCEFGLWAAIWVLVLRCYWLERLDDPLCHGTAGRLPVTPKMTCVDEPKNKNNWQVERRQWQRCGWCSLDAEVFRWVVCVKHRCCDDLSFSLSAVWTFWLTGV